MVFSSIVFLFLFLPATLLVYAAAGARFRNIFLLCASIIFYAWGEQLYVLVMAASILANYTCGVMMVRRSDGRPSRTILAVGVLVNLAVLGFFKYSNFVADNINVLLGLFGMPAFAAAPVHLPIGISFFTFQAMSYIIDVYRQKVTAQKNIISLGLYISLFPQLIAGPIVRYHDIAEQLARRSMDLNGFAYGVQRFLFGLSKKVLLANPIGAIADQIFSLPASELTAPLAWLGAVCYTLQIYFDFSGYSDMAIGLGRMFGFHFLENFNYPYISRSIREFWRRWHISLSNWLRDYLYVSLGGNRKGYARTYLNLIIVFTLCGLWHGASWTFVLWGLYHGFFLVLERTRIGGMLAGTHKPLQYLWTLFIVIIGWVIFRSETFAYACGYIGAMFGFGQGSAARNPIGIFLDTKAMIEIGFAIALSMPVYPFLARLKAAIVQQLPHKLGSGLNAGAYLVEYLVIVSLVYADIISLAAGVYNPFIYFRF
ncbi:MAG TPA: MBOAT family protein [Deltaproteobacteria bacterium]|nr:MBOAT family protein [Deltaproteobacteria bacterium]